MSYTGLVKSLPISLPISLPHGLAKQGGIVPGFTLSGNLPDGDQATDYVGVLNISGGVPPYINPTAAVGVLPAEFTLTIIGAQLFVTATAPITFSGLVDVTYDAEDSAAAHAQDHAPFTIHVSTFILTEAGDPILTEDGKFLLAET